MLSREEQTKRWLIVHIYTYIVQKMLLIVADCVFFGSPYDAATTFRMGARFEYIKFMAKKNWIKLGFSGLDLLLLEGFLRTLPSITLHILRKITAKWKSLMQEMLMVIHSTSWLPWIKHICTPRNCGIRQVELLVLGEIIPCHGACSELPGM